MREPKTLNHEDAQDPLLVLACDIENLHDEMEAAQINAGLPVHPGAIVKDLRERMDEWKGLLTAFELTLKQIARGDD